MKSFFPISMLFALLLAGIAANSFAAESSKMLKVFTKNEAGVTHLYVQNLEESPVTTTFEMKMENMKGSADFPFTTIVPPKKTVEAFTLCPMQNNLPWKFRYTHFTMMGTPTAAHDNAFIYQLPYAPGTAYRVSQGYHGAFSHSGPDEFAIDWKMPVGTPVRAAREGLVVKSKDDSSEGGADRKYEDKANTVFILHSDETIGIYAHLQKGGNVVKVGDRVKAGEILGLSGNTGFSSGPHLHFAVCKAKDGKERVSLPVKYRSANEGVATLEMGHTYEAVALPGTIADTSKPMVVNHAGLVSSAR